MQKILFFLITAILTLDANSLKIDSPLSILDKYEYVTPDDRKVRIPHKSKLLIVSFEKKTSALVNDFLVSQEKYYLQKNHSLFIADIHKMPRFITNMFALPKMKEYKHLLYLHYGKEFAHAIPSKDKHLTLIEVRDRKVSKISFSKNINEIKLAIEK